MGKLAEGFGVSVDFAAARAEAEGRRRRFEEGTEVFGFQNDVESELAENFVDQGGRAENFDVVAVGFFGEEFEVFGGFVDAGEKCVFVFVFSAEHREIAEGRVVVVAAEFFVEGAEFLEISLGCEADRGVVGVESLEDDEFGGG